MRYFLEMAFKGTHYAGWQVQENAVAVQQKINEALSTIASCPVETLGCGRTDTGVHAKQFFVQFDWKEKISDPSRFIFQLNGILPYDIVIFDLHEVSPDASARHDAIARTYEYYIYSGKNPFLREFATWYTKKYDISLLNKAAAELLGYDDFACFSKSRTEVKHFICHITEAGWNFENGLLVFRITSNRFLRGMVRAIVGTLLQVGSGEISIHEFRSIIESKDRKKAGASVPAQGLYLSAVRYLFLPVGVNNRNLVFEILG